MSKANCTSWKKTVGEEVISCTDGAMVVASCVKNEVGIAVGIAVKGAKEGADVVGLLVLGCSDG